LVFYKTLAIDHIIKTPILERGQLMSNENTVEMTKVVIDKMLALSNHLTNLKDRSPADTNMNIRISAVIIPEFSEYLNSMK